MGVTGIFLSKQSLVEILDCCFGLTYGSNPSFFFRSPCIFVRIIGWVWALNCSEYHGWLLLGKDVFTRLPGMGSWGICSYNFK